MAASLSRPTLIRLTFDNEYRKGIEDGFQPLNMRLG
jgi:hypothetical protein